MDGDEAIIVGIDLGTTMSAVCVQRESEIVFIKNELGESLTPSVVAYDAKSGGLVVGRLAKDILVAHPENGAALFKRAIGADTRFKIGQREHSAVELSAQLLDQLRSDCERFLECRVERCVITVPAYFSESQRHATKQAGEMAGLIVERILSEPTAAAIAYGMHQGQVERTFVVLDLGGGTFDVCVMELFEGLLEVKSVAGESQLGGEDFTEALASLALARLQIDYSNLTQRDRMLLRKRAELLKRKLTRWSSAEIEIPGVDRSVVITQEEADHAYQPLLERMIKPCRAALRGAGVLPKDIEEVLLVGGATRMPCVHSLAERIFERPPALQDDPDHVVARGAGLQGALCANDKSVADIAVTDVAAHSLGMEVVREVGGRLNDGYFCPLIERNTLIPTSRAEVFSTLSANQRVIEVVVYEGENRLVKNCERLGELRIKGIPKGPPRPAIEVRFTYDLNGMLEVEATLLDKPSVVITKILNRGNTALSEKDLLRAEARLRRLKADASERPMYRDLLSRASALWEEVRGQERETLDLATSQFEAALETRNPQEIENSYDVLLRVCEGLDSGERW